MIARWIDIWLDWLDQFRHLVAPQSRDEFCRACGASIPHRYGEGTCPKCDPSIKPSRGACRCSPTTGTSECPIHRSGDM